MKKTIAKEKALTKKQIQMRQDVNNFLSLQEAYDNMQNDFEDVSTKLNERLTHILCVICDALKIKPPRILHWINIECNNDKLAREERDLGFQTEDEEVFVLGLYPCADFIMPYFPTWFFWESDKKIAAYCKKVEEERLVHTKIAEDKEISAEQTIRKIYNKLSQEECVFLKDAFGVKF